jgi:large subunit ribosomal protein L6
MSRIGKLPVPVPSGVTADWKAPVLKVKGPKGAMAVEVKQPCGLEFDGKVIKVTRPDDARESKRSQGLYRSLVRNAVEGVSKGFERRLEVIGVGYKAEAAGKVLKLSLGFAKPVEFPVPPGIEIKVEKDTIVVSGIDRVLVGNVSARIRSFRPPEPYQGKGVRYQGEYVRRKAGKAGVGGGAPGGGGKK